MVRAENSEPVSFPPDGGENAVPPLSCLFRELLNVRRTTGLNVDALTALNALTALIAA